MTKQKVFHKEAEDNNDLDYISENCNNCKEELIRVEDIFVGENNNYYCEDCAKYNNIRVVECKEIY